LIEIASFIGRDSETAARRLIAQILEATERLAEFPESGRVIPEDPGSDTRELIVGNYRIIYRTAGPKVQISAVVHGAREISLEDVPPVESSGE
jgi:plasmid stabilization system protein ParE